MKTTNISPSRRMQIQPEYLQFRRVNLSGNLNASKVKIGETVIQLGSIVDMNEESQILHQPNNLKIKRLKTRIRKRAKLLKISKLRLFRFLYLIEFYFIKTLALNYLPRRSPSKYCRRFITFHN